MGDALLTYENEAYFTNLVVPEKDRLPYIVPDNNIRVSPLDPNPPPVRRPRAPFARLGDDRSPGHRAGQRGCACVVIGRGVGPLALRTDDRFALARRRPAPQIQCPISVIDHNLAPQAPEVREAATAFCQYLYTKEAQREFAACGFRCGHQGGQPARPRGLWCSLREGCLWWKTWAKASQGRHWQR